MGRPYLSEISRLSCTYEWALNENLDALTSFLKESSGTPLYTVGSGGSYSAAAFAAFLSQSIKREHAAAVTPLEAIALPQVRHASVLIFSAGGNNSDVIRAFQSVVSNEPMALGVVCLQPSSKLCRTASMYEFVQLWCKGAPAGKDGFLATNSLVAFFVLAHRMFCPDVSLPSSYSALESLCHFSPIEAESTLRRESLVVLYGPSTKAAAFDFESKMSEAALSSVQLADFRNFAHGRHHWIAKKHLRTGVVAFVSPEDDDVGRRTLKLVRQICPVLMVETTGRGSLASVSSLTAVLNLTSVAGKIRKVDPGRPGVPEFGRRIYSLRPKGKIPLPGAAPSIDVVIARKMGPLLQTTVQEKQTWSLQAVSYLERLQEITFRAVALDFDDTLCGLPERFGQLRRDVVSQLERLANHGMRIGIATGRGKSVRSQMQASLNPSCWQNFVIAYYNGAEVGGLGDDSRPDTRKGPAEQFEILSKSVASDPTLAKHSRITVRAQQITLEPRETVPLDWLWREAQRAVASSQLCTKVIHSTRSVDIVARETSKTALFDVFARDGIPKGALLCIGDLGEYPGNDFELLRDSNSLSCNRASSDPVHCWNFAPAGFRGVQATLYYLSRLEPNEGGVHLRLGALR